MPRAILANNLFVDPDQESQALDTTRLERTDFSTSKELRELYRPSAPRASSDEPPPQSFSWPEFEEKTAGAIH
jgi:hypothetical protein